MNEPRCKTGFIGEAIVEMQKDLKGLDCNCAQGEEGGVYLCDQHKPTHVNVDDGDAKAIIARALSIITIMDDLASHGKTPGFNAFVWTQIHEFKVEARAFLARLEKP